MKKNNLKDLYSPKEIYIFYWTNWVRSDTDVDVNEYERLSKITLTHKLE
jgi:hypothetical protein